MIGGQAFCLRSIRVEEAEQAASMEQICFPPNEACTPVMMIQRVQQAPDMFLVAEECESGRLVGMVCGLATSETCFRDEFFSDASLYQPDGENVMLLGVEVLPEYQHHGLASRMMEQYLQRERARGRRCVYLTCLDDKVGMYEKMGFTDLGFRLPSGA